MAAASTDPWANVRRIFLGIVLGAGLALILAYLFGLTIGLPLALGALVVLVVFYIIHKVITRRRRTDDDDYRSAPAGRFGALLVAIAVAVGGTYWYFNSGAVTTRGPIGSMLVSDNAMSYRNDPAEMFGRDFGTQPITALVISENQALAVTAGDDIYWQDGNVEDERATTDALPWPAFYAGWQNATPFTLDEVDFSAALDAYDRTNGVLTDVESPWRVGLTRNPDGVFVIVVGMESSEQWIAYNEDGIELSRSGNLPIPAQ